MDAWMDVWAAIRQLDVLTSAAIFAAGAASLAIVQGVVRACRRVIARRRAARAHWVSSSVDVRQLRTELEGLRAACDFSAANLEAGVARLKRRALERVRELERTTGELRDVRAQLAERTALAEALRQAKADLELCKQEHLLRLHHHDGELRAHENALATAERTIAMLRGALERPGQVSPPVPGRAAV